MIEEYLEGHSIEELVEAVGNAQGINGLIKATLRNACINDAEGYAKAVKRALVGSGELFLELIKLLQEDYLFVSCLECRATYPEFLVVDLSNEVCPSCGAKHSFMDVI